MKENLGWAWRYARIPFMTTNIWSTSGRDFQLQMPGDMTGDDIKKWIPRFNELRESQRKFEEENPDFYSRSDEDE